MWIERLRSKDIWMINAACMRCARTAPNNVQLSPTWKVLGSPYLHEGPDDRRTHNSFRLCSICWPFPAVLRPIIITAYLYTSMQKLQQQLHVHLSIIIIIILYFDEACSTAYGLEITVASVGKKLRYRIETVNLSCMQNIKFRKGHNDSQIR